jgi:hypothetical protein
MTTIVHAEDRLSPAVDKSLSKPPSVTVTVIKANPSVPALPLKLSSASTPLPG